tara:strand:+ start:130 stop:732 length:603 start_codon:yes stop_codon:yes gene_type:complete
MKKQLFLPLLLICNVFSIEYESVHDATYWFYDDGILEEGWHMGTVRSNLVYGDKLNFYISKDSCDQIPGMYFILSSNHVAKKKKKDLIYDIKALEGEKITFNAYIDQFEPFTIDATIDFADSNLESSRFIIKFDDGMPREFISAKKDDVNSFIEVMMLEIPKNDPNYKYFDITQIKFRMGGLAHVWMHAYEQCMSAKETT